MNLALNLPPADRSAFRLAEPFPHVIVDGAFADADLAAVLAEWPTDDAPGWQGFAPSENERGKRQGSAPDMWTPTAAAVLGTLQGPQFIEWLTALTGIPNLTPDAIGGGYHDVPRGGLLGVHVDFNVHPTRDDLHRRLNVLLYLNAHWTAECGGELLLGADPETRVRVAPLFNRLVVFATSERSYHGHPDPWNHDLPRRSLACYFYSPEAAEPAEVHSTRWLS